MVIQLVQTFTILVLLWWLVLQGRRVLKLDAQVRELRAQVHAERMIRFYGVPDGLPRPMPTLGDMLDRPYKKDPKDSES